MNKALLLISLISLVSLSYEIDFCFIEKKRCKTCLAGYTLSDDTTNGNSYCIQFDNCETFSEDGKTCTKCKDGYVLKEEGTKCEQDPCSHYDSETNICDTCNSNYQLNSETKICEPNISHCSRLYFDGSCGECEKGYAWNSVASKCVEFPNCSETDETGAKCTNCKYDYYKVNKEGQCVMDFCEEYDDESGKCKKCQKYFYLDDDFNCVYINIPFCRKLDENKECKGWADFYEHDDDVHKAKEKYETGCERWNEEGICTVCNYPFILNSETKTCSMNCEEYSEPLCEYCEHGYILYLITN